MGRSPRLAVATAIVLAVLAPALVAAQAARLDDAHGIRVDAVEQLDPRQLAVRVSTEALQHPVDVRILLPDGYDAGADRRYPVLYLFHGTSGRASDWVVAGNVVATTAGAPLIVVMPDAGFNGDGGGWFADWFNGGAGGQPMWETFHIRQVIPWIDANLNTVASRRGRAVAGLSQGGFGSLSYASRHPELFTSVASFSGGCVISTEPQVLDVASGIIRFTTSALSGADPDAVFGPTTTNLINWNAHDPGFLFPNLRGMHVGLWTGDGEPGLLDPTPIDAGASGIEVITFFATQLLHGYLNEAGIRHEYNYYGGGTHIWPYWARDLEEYLPELMRRFRRPGRRPLTVSYLSAEDRWQQWGWGASFERPERAFSRLRRARKTGFTLTGTGRATIRTPRFYEPGARLRVDRVGDVRESTIELVASPNGRLSIPVMLSEGKGQHTTTVRIRPAR